TNAYGINNAGEIVGDYFALADTVQTQHGQHGFRLSSGSYITLDVPGSYFTSPHGINNAGQITGTYANTSSPGDTSGVVLSGGRYTTLNVPGARTLGIPRVTGINDAGMIVGSYVGADSKTHGFVASPVPPLPTFTWHGPTMTITTGVTGVPAF